MAETRICATCGVNIAARQGGDACPACLLELGLHRYELQDAIDARTAAHDEGKPPKFRAPAPEELATRFPQLEILQLVGHGGMGAVYKARQVRLDRFVALKIVVPDTADEPGFAERFEREARSLAKLNHPHVVTVYDFGIADGLYYLVMEYVDGTNLRHMIQAGELTPKSALAMVPQICDALQFAHDEGIVHRDVKPENILIDRQGNVKIADFGLAKLLDRSSSYRALTRTGQIVGTPQYMAPEQLERPLEVDHRADIYSLGVVFYEMLTGELPLGRFKRPSKSARVDNRLDRVVLRALDKEPDRRYQQVSEIGGAVRSLHGSASTLSFGRESADDKLMEGFFVNLFLIAVTAPLVGFTIWWTETPWALYGFCLPWLFVGYYQEYSAGHLFIWAEAAACFLTMMILIGYSVWVTRDALAITSLAAVLLAFAIGGAAGENDRKKVHGTEDSQQNESDAGSAED